MTTKNGKETTEQRGGLSFENALSGCHLCASEKSCHFPFKPLRADRCDGDKFWSEDTRRKYDSDMHEEREAAIRSEIRPVWSSAT